MKRCIPFRSLRRVMLLFASAAMLAGCALLPGKPAPSIDLQALRECQQLGKRQPIPKIDAQSDYRDLSPEALAALKKANDGITSRTKCEDEVIAQYAKPQ